MRLNITYADASFDECTQVSEDFWMDLGTSQGKISDFDEISKIIKENEAPLGGIF